MSLSKEQLLQHSRRIEVLKLDIGEVKVRTFNGSDRDRFVTAAIAATDKKSVEGLQAMLVQMSVVNGDGELMFDSVAEANTLDSAIQKQIADFVQDINHLGDESPKGPAPT